MAPANDVLDVAPLNGDAVAKAESICREMLDDPLVCLMRERVEETDSPPLEISKST
jgi:hypothetical protein